MADLHYSDSKGFVPMRKPTELDNMNRLRVQAEKEARAYRDMLVRITNAVSISQFHALLCEAKELLAADGVGTPDGGQSNG